MNDPSPEPKATVAPTLRAWPAARVNDRKSAVRMYGGMAEPVVGLKRMPPGGGGFHKSLWVCLGGVRSFGVQDGGAEEGGRGMGRPGNSRARQRRVTAVADWGRGSASEHFLSVMYRTTLCTGGDAEATSGGYPTTWRWLSPRFGKLGLSGHSRL